ncbi:MAG TPA: transporter [Rhodocyclaceae bacterium]|nr:MAG: transporter [Rhodocyclales bacterium CG17_big_fil_post_rev_8_21_14_2_50_68_7]PIX74803.1 MAG: transporter [Rhodocyclales bacterium CG_4_10_14_3_um_filter_68_10]PJA57171.1 MAG: transporter [Rhodocyclales bacterium CG_4_9_14_3_um_filter_68_10]HCX33589.1 transporter [Rhodocyclaceae bacterium]
MMMTTTLRRLLSCAMILAAASALQACFPVVATGVGTGALMIADRRAPEVYLMDEGIELRLLGRINDRYGDRVHINVTSYNRNVLLTGEAPDAAAKAEIGKIAAGQDNVRAVINELQVAPPTAYSSRSNDSFITSKVKARFVDANRFPANHVKVVTEDRVVFLLGIVTRKEAEAAAEIARTTGDVRKVVKVFEYIGDDAAQRLDSRPAQKK